MHEGEVPIKACENSDSASSFDIILSGLDLLKISFWGVVQK